MFNHKIKILFFSLMISVLPSVVFAQIAFPCDGPDCDFNDLVTLINDIIQFLIYKVAVPLAALGIMYSGIKLIFNQNKEGAWTEAKKSFEFIGTGFAMILGAYVLIKFILFQFLTVEQATFMNFLFQ